MFDKDRLLLLKKQFPNRSFFFLERVDSTNNFAKTVELSSNSSAVILAFEQYAGKGQRTNTWISEPGKSLTFSILSKPPKSFNTQHYLLAISLAIHATLKEELGLNAEIKWPNDILVNGKKLAGILVEAIFEGNNFKSLITGIGINANQKQFSSSIDKDITSLSLELSDEIDLIDLLSKLLLSIASYIKEYEAKHFSSIFKKVNEVLAFKNQKVSVLINRELALEATIIGIDDNGALWVRDEHENFRKFMNEQISITPIS